MLFSGFLRAPSRAFFWFSSCTKSCFFCAFFVHQTVLFFTFLRAPNRAFFLVFFVHQIVLFCGFLRAPNGALLRATVTEVGQDTTDDYCASPMAVFTSLAPRSLDPEFCLHSNAIRLLQQALQASGDHQHFTQIVGATLPAHDGPAARAFELLQHDAFRDTVQSILNNRPLSPQHPHELRQSWRKYVWNNLA